MLNTTTSSVTTITKQYISFLLRNSFVHIDPELNHHLVLHFETTTVTNIINKQADDNKCIL